VGEEAKNGNHPLNPGLNISWLFLHDWWRRHRKTRNPLCSSLTEAERPGRSSQVQMKGETGIANNSYFPLPYGESA
jgi:hypothetical protein